MALAASTQQFRKWEDQLTLPKIEINQTSASDIRKDLFARTGILVELFVDYVFIFEV